ncbi:Lycopene epsilon cyclase, chloroplastic [Dichanthelium oligosanthes]|uniref:Lycopene epsilon cyclase, chloroplastic n=1 Tax=Dichanthelium oligosanthes TaxID=888268 RepID=A0A1E5UTU4_9POAL|nr:Lycopene epsilon cyclase, chloroplastic [Dichanthelium oligosanthes]
MGLSGAAISAPLGCRGLPRGAVGGGKVRSRAEAERWRRAGSGRCLGGAKVSCVATEKHDETAAAAVGVEFADEEDYRKGGGGELLYVQMQATKPMESQSKIASKLLPISDENSILDLVIIGCGPAGLSLASESAKKGLTVGLIGPDLPFTNNYGVWEDEFKDLGLESCIEHVWKDTIVYLDNNKPILIGRSYGRVHRDLLHEELLRRCYEAGVTYLNSKVDKIIESPDGHRVVYCERGREILCRLAIVASGAASGFQSNTLSQETCLASKDAMPFDVLKKRLMYRLDVMGVRILKIHEEEWSYIPVGGSLPNTDQKNLAFGAAASMVHPATGMDKSSIFIHHVLPCSLADTDNVNQVPAQYLPGSSHNYSPSMLAWRTLWPQERKRQRSFFLFGLALIIQLNNEGIQTFFEAFFRVPKWMWRGFLGSTLSSVDLILFSFYMFAIAPNQLRMNLVRHLLSDPTGSTMIKTYLTL